MDIDIKILKEIDEKAITKIHKLIFQLANEEITPNLEDFRNFLNLPNTYLFVAIAENEIVGMGTFVYYVIPTGKKGWIEDIVVDENQRGKGIAEKLIGTMLETAKTIGMTQVNLTSSYSRISANKLYQKIGFYTRETNVYRIDL
jgi:ribosomal protein S18 acetylase RimI-like enzyme